MFYFFCLKVVFDSFVYVNINGVVFEEVRDDDNSVFVFDIDEDGFFIFVYGDLYFLFFGVIYINMYGRCFCVYSYMVVVGFDVDWDQCIVDDCYGCFRVIV